MIFSEARRVLVYRLGSLGDTIVALPSLHLIAHAFPGAQRRLLTNVPVASKAPPAAAVLENMDLIHGYMRYTPGTRNVVELLSLVAKIHAWNPDYLVYLAGARGIRAARRDRRFFQLCGIVYQIGVPLTPAMQANLGGLEPEPATSPATTPFETELEPEAERLARNISALGYADLDSPGSWDLQLTSSEHDAAIRAIGPEVLQHEVFAVSVGTKVQSKDWGRDNWRELLSRIPILYPGRALMLVGSTEESEASDFAAANWQTCGGGPVVNLCGRLNPRQSAAALSRARLFVGHDSGPMHLAAAVGTPCAAVFAARNVPRQWFPYGPAHQVIYHRVECAGCGLETCIEQKKKCILSISVEEVLLAIRSILMAAPPDRAPSLHGWLRPLSQHENASVTSETAPMADPAAEPVILKHRRPFSDDPSETEQSTGPAIEPAIKHRKPFTDDL